MTFLKSGIFQLFLSVFLAFFIVPYLSIYHISFFYSLSLVLKDFLMIILPFIIFFCLSSVLSGFKSSAPLLVLGVIIFVILSNMMTVLTAYGVGYFLLPEICREKCILISNLESKIEPLFRLPIQSIIKNEYALLLGVIVGLITTFLQSHQQQKIARFLNKGKHNSTLILKKCFIPFLPIYVFGFVLKLHFDGALSSLLDSYGKIFCINLALIIGYVFVMYLIAARFSFKKTFFYIQNMLPAGLTGLSTMSSMAALPITLKATEDNTNNEEFSEFIIPSTANIHMVGDGLNIALTAIALLLMTRCDFPLFSTYMVFVLHYCIVKFSGVGVPGGGVLVILPVVQTYLGLNSELTSLLATIYILQDAILTSANVMANGAFAIIVHNVFKKIKLIKT
ncbi:MAG: cation:dicarboxylase symporter family transporter [Proteobacteria bacterium]|nr:cation:dicarboxylase symporter family transporter [Pseudomonadota bacterium]